MADASVYIFLIALLAEHPVVCIQFAVDGRNIFATNDCIRWVHSQSLSIQACHALMARMRPTEFTDYSILRNLRSYPDKDLRVHQTMWKCQLNVAHTCTGSMEESSIFVNFLKFTRLKCRFALQKRQIIYALYSLTAWVFSKNICAAV